MNAILLPFQRRYILLTLVAGGTAASAALVPLWIGFAAPAAAFGALTLLGLRDITQRRHSILRNYPIAAHIRFLLEEIRPEIRQYFLEDETTGIPFARKKRSIVYQPGEHAPRQWAEGISIEVNRALGQAELIAKRGEWVLTVKR